MRSLTSVLRVLELDLVCRQRVFELLLVRRKLVNFRLIRIISGFQRINDVIPFFHLFPERSDVSLSWDNPVCLGKTPASDSKCHQHTEDFTVFFDLCYYPAHTMCSLTHVKSLSLVARRPSTAPSGGYGEAYGQETVRARDGLAHSAPLMSERLYRGHEERWVIQLVLGYDAL